MTRSSTAGQPDTWCRSPAFGQEIEGSRSDAIDLSDPLNIEIENHHHPTQIVVIYGAFYVMLPIRPQFLGSLFIVVTHINSKRLLTCQFEINMLAKFFRQIKNLLANNLQGGIQVVKLERILVTSLPSCVPSF